MTARTVSEIHEGQTPREILENLEDIENWKHLHEFVRDECEGILIGSARAVRNFYTQTIHELLQGNHAGTAKEHAQDINWLTDTMPGWILREFRKAIESNQVDLLFSCDVATNTGEQVEKITWENITE